MTPKPLMMKYYDDQQTGSIRKALEKDVLSWPGVTAKPMMGCLCYFHGKKFFAFVDNVPKLEGDKLKRPPAGFDPDHPFIEDLKRKDLITGREFTRAQVLGPGFLNEFVQVGKELDPLNRFIAQAMGLPW